jgi:hypothetical protein
LNHTIRKLSWCMLACGSLVSLAASPPVIGVAKSRGVFLIDNASVPGSATILDGTSVRTAATSSDITLKSGEHLTLASGSAAKVFQDHLVLEGGVTELAHASSYRIDTPSLQISTSDAEAIMQVAAGSNNQVKVIAIRGTAEVRNRQGILVARVLPGRMLNMEPAAGTTVMVAGIMEAHAGKFFLTDITTNVKVELRGPNLKHLVGKQIQISGSAASGEAPAAGASQVIVVSQATVPGATAGSAGAAAVGVSSGTLAIVGGVAAAATVAGLVVTGVVGEGDPTLSR